MRFVACSADNQGSGSQKKELGRVTVTYWSDLLHQD